MLCLVSSVLAVPSGGAQLAGRPASLGARNEVQAGPVRGFSVEVARLLLEAPSGGSLLCHLSAHPLPRLEGKALLPVVIEVDGAGLLNGFEGDRMAVEIYLYALRPDGAVSAYLAQRVEVELSELGEAVFDSGLKFSGQVELEAGDYELRALVKRGQAFGLASRTIAVAEAPDPMALPVIADPAARDAWVVVRRWRKRVAGEKQALLVADERPVRPSAHPVLVAGRAAAVFVFSTRALNGSGRCRIELVERGSEEEVYESAPCRIEATAEPLGESPLRASIVRFELPRMDAGEFLLRLMTRAGGDEPVRSKTTPVVVLDGATRERELLWTDLRWTEPADESSEEPSSTRSRAGPRRLRSSYQAALKALATEGSNAAKAAVLEMESSALGKSSGKAFRQLVDAERHVAEGLAEGDVEALVPLFVLHTDLYRTYVDRRVFSLAAHSKAMVSNLVEIYVENGGGPEVASQALTSLAAYLQQANLRSGSGALFEKALELDPEAAPALIGLASLLEKFNDLQGSVRSLREVVAFAPNDSEAVLRLGVDLCRSGLGRQGREILQGLVTTPASPWILRLAHESLARSLMKEGRYEDALAALLDGVERLPEAERPYLLAAMVFDRLGRPHDSIDMVRRYSVRRLSTAPSARLTYDSWPREGVEELRAELALLATNHLQRLSSALAHLEG